MSFRTAAPFSNLIVAYLRAQEGEGEHEEEDGKSHECDHCSDKKDGVADRLVEATRVAHADNEYASKDE